MGVKTADRTLDLLELFSREKKALSLSEISACLDMPMSSTHALIKTLEDRGYITEMGRRRGYYPTNKLKLVSDAVSEGVSLLKTLEPLLAELCEQTQETVIVAKQQGTSGIYVAACISPQSVRFSPNLGEAKPLHSTATGKALLGALSETELKALLPKLSLPALTPRTITDEGQLMEAIRLGNERGWHEVVGENILDLMSIAKAVTIDDLHYAIGLAGSVQRFQPQTEQHAEKLLSTCARISALTGH